MSIQRRQPSHSSDALQGNPSSNGVMTSDEAYIAVNADSAKPKLTLIRKLAYGVGHVFNDLCVSLWLSYLIIFYHYVIGLSHFNAGLLYLIGQIADAVATPIIGYFCDKLQIRFYGRRKFWHLCGTIVVAILYFFYWHKCLNCENAIPRIKVLYYAVPITVIQFGWTSVQISHLALIPDLTDDKNERMELNAIRYAFTILANIGVFVNMFLLLQFVSKAHTALDTHSITPSDLWIFSGTALGIVGVGLFFSLLFHLGTREPRLSSEEMNSREAKGLKISWFRWFIKPRFYLVALIYMCSKMAISVVQVYIPLFLFDTLQLSKECIAIGPLVVYISGFIMTFFLKLFNKFIGRHMVYFIGIVLVWGGLEWLWLTDTPDNRVEEVILYGAIVLLGAGVATLQVNSLAMIADLIGPITGSSAFVYGIMSFTDKLSNGIAVQLIQGLNPCNQFENTNSSSSCSKGNLFYRYTLVYVPGGASILAAIALALLSLLLYFNAKSNASSTMLSPARSINADGFSRPLYPGKDELDQSITDKTPLFYSGSTS